MDPKKIFVGSLPWSIASEGLRELFAEFGDIVDAVVITNRDTGQSKGFGFVTFATEDSAQKALEKNGAEVEGRTIVVNIAKPKEERPRRDFGRGGGAGSTGGGDRRRDTYRRDY